MYSYGPPHMAKQKQDDQLEHTYSSYVRIRDVALKTCQRRWTIGRSGERGSGISVPAARHDDDDVSDSFLKFVDKFTYLGSCVSSTERGINMRLAKAWTVVIDRLSITWKSNQSDKINRDFFQAAVVSLLLYGCTPRTLTKHIEEKLVGSYTSCIEQILEATSHETTVVRPPTSYL